MATPPRLDTASLRAALLGPLPLGVLASAEIAALVIHSVPLAALGGITWAALVAWDLVRASEGPPPPAPRAAPTLPDPSGLRDPAVVSAVRAVLRARAERERALALTPDAMKGPVQQAIGSVLDLERHVASLAARAEELHGWLLTQDAHAVEAEEAALAERVRRTTDPDARTDYERALAAKAAQLTAVRDIATARDRVHANLARIAATLEGLPPQLVRLRALDEAALDTFGGEVGAELQALNGEMQLFEQTLHSLTTGGPWPGAGAQA